MQKKAFTLIELIVALAIMGILSSLIAPSFFEYQRTKNLDLAAQLLETALSESFSASRSTPHIFGVKGVVATSQIKTFSCSYPNCDLEKKTQVVPIPKNVQIQNSFEIRYLPPHGDISLDSEKFFDITLKNNRDQSRTIRIYKSSGLVERILSQ